jgi:AcrR family transcriptional regulator
VPRPKQRTSHLRDRLLDAALATLVRAGAAGLTTREVARAAQTSTPAVYELFGDKAGLVREMFFEGFRRLRRHLDTLEESRDARADIVAMIWSFRAFILENPRLSELMFARRFTDFDPGPAELEAGAAVRRFIVARVQRGIDAGALTGDASDAAHVLVALAQGLAATELAGWLGRSRASRERRWRLGIDAVVGGLGGRARRPASTRRLITAPSARAPAAGRRQS